jgi:indole-3-acetate monooxygenase
LNYDEIEAQALGVAASMVPTLAEHADEFESERNLPLPIARELAEGGLMNMCASREFGGMGATPLAFAKVVELLATADASAAWCAFISTTAAATMSRRRTAAMRDALSARGTIAAGAFAPTGKAVPHERHGVQGFLVTGEWAWGSGSRNADVVSGGCVIVDGDGKAKLRGGDAPMLIHAVLSGSQIEHRDTWNVMGLQGTGSAHFRATDAFVPESLTFEVVDDGGASDPLGRFPVFGMLALGVAAVSLGTAVAALREATEIVQSKPGGGRSGRSAANRPAVQQTIAHGDAALRAARLGLHDAVEQAWTRALSAPVPLRERARLRAAITYAAETARAVVDDAFRVSGGSAVYRTSGLQRRFRDVHAAGQHVMVADASYELAGRVLLGVPVDASML